MTLSIPEAYGAAIAAERAWEHEMANDPVCRRTIDARYKPCSDGAPGTTLYTAYQTFRAASQALHEAYVAVRG